jgi:hypothetical protein
VGVVGVDATIVVGFPAGGGSLGSLVALPGNTELGSELAPAVTVVRRELHVPRDAQVPRPRAIHRTDRADRARRSASDTAAYKVAGVPANRIFIYLPEFADEVMAAISAHQATAFTDYRKLDAMLAAAMRSVGVSSVP